MLGITNQSAFSILTLRKLYKLRVAYSFLNLFDSSELLVIIVIIIVVCPMLVCFLFFFCTHDTFYFI